MKREIKFRVWDEKLLVMFTQEKELEIKNLWKIPAANGGELNYPNGVLMQFTGLKDKHGNPIYEGDVVILFGGKARPIVFDMGAYGYYVDEKEPWGYFISLAQNNNFEWVAYQSSKIEVIGNIYQHPYLLSNVQ